MTRARLFIVCAGAFVVGAAAGGGLVWFDLKNSAEAALGKTAALDASNRLHALGALRAGNASAAYAALEAGVNYDLSVLGHLPEANLSPAAGRTIRAIAAYRANYPYRPGDAAVDADVDAVLSRHSAKPGR